MRDAFFTFISPISMSFIKRTLMLGVLAAACSSSVAIAADFFVVVPLKGRTGAGGGTENPGGGNEGPAAPEVKVTLSSYSLPSAREDEPYVGFDFNNLLTVSGADGYDSAAVHWALSPALPAGLNFANGLLSGTPVAPSSGHQFQVTASHQDKQGAQTYILPIAVGACRSSREDYRPMYNPLTVEISVPKNCTTLTIKAWGAPGRVVRSMNFFGEAQGGGGGYATGTFKVTPGEMLTVDVPFMHISTRVDFNSGPDVMDFMSNAQGGGGGAAAVVSKAGSLLVVAGGGGGAGVDSMGNYYAGNGGGSSDYPRNYQGSTFGVQGRVMSGSLFGSGGAGYPTGGGEGSYGNLGGQGGESFVDSSAYESSTSAASGSTAGNSGDPDNQGAGNAGVTDSGAVVLIWSD